MNGYLCDTNVISELMRRDPNARVLDWAAAQRDFQISAITCEEIYAGLSKQGLSRKRQWFDKLIAQQCKVLEVDLKISMRAGEIRGQLLAKGQTHSQADMLIAATAWHRDLTVVTRNVGDFEGCGISILNPFG